MGIIPIPKNNAILPTELQLLSNNNDSVMFVRIIGINPKYLIPLNHTPYSLLPTPYSQGNVAKLLRNSITESVAKTIVRVIFRLRANRKSSLF
ncbi:MAG: hypothetical protein F6K54_37240 [Okeania sp. SIO3B5]|uniref:hypothetical protein n=1 Tax=Okeania sp. SIO3B5 TaxID=2607811 RepID=UPI001400C5D1|nr:hypothetical protein [Okeania sp. SIO3B5]NEO58207.1 hypothetical protein [Okeania sp. SIO3B5]